MRVNKDLNKCIISVFDDRDFRCLELKFLTDEFTWIFNKNDITLTKDLDKPLFDSFNTLLDSKYDFRDGPSYQKEDEIVWFSDCYFDKDDKEFLKRVSRVSIKREEDNIKLHVSKPYEEEIGLHNEIKIIAFSPAGNGMYSRNLVTGNTFQSDVVSVFFNTLRDKKLIKKR